MNFVSTSLTAAAPVSNAFVVVMGIGVVFIGLICIILLIKLMSVIMGSVGGKQVDAPAAAPTPTPAAGATTAAGAVPAVSQSPAISSVIENRAEIVAAVCAAAAEELGTDVSALRVVSFKKIS